MESPLEQFAIRPLFHLPIAGYDLAFTNSSLAMMFAFLATLWLFTVGTAKNALIPGRLQSTAESMYQFIQTMVEDNIGHGGERFFPLIFSIFMIVLLGNVLGLIPMNFTYTSHIIVTAAMALFVFLLVIVIGVVRHGLSWFGLFLPSGVPLWLAPIMVPVEIISFLSRPLSLSVRPLRQHAGRARHPACVRRVLRSASRASCRIWSGAQPVAPVRQRRIDWPGTSSCLPASVRFRRHELHLFT